MEYRYRAKNIDSKVVRGRAEARDQKELYQELRKKDLFLIHASEVKKKVLRYKLKSMELSEFSRQIASMADAGITVLRALAIMKEQTLKPQVLRVYTFLFDYVQRGQTLSAAMKASEGAFPDLMINMYNAGEYSGNLANTALKMAVYYEKEHRTNTKIRNAMMYPIILTVVIVIVIIILFTFILPQFFGLFDDIDLPAITQLMMNISTFLTEKWYIVLAVVLLLVIGGKQLSRLPEVKRFRHKVMLKMPKIGPLLEIIYTARFARTLSSLYSSGLAMITALEITSTIIGNTYIESQFSKAIALIRQGRPLSHAISTIDGFDKKLTSTILIGEETGSLDSMLESVADSYEYEATMAIERMIAIMEPALIIVLAVIVGAIMLSVMMPLMSIYQDIGTS